MADERNLVDEEDTVKENSAQNRREKKKREKKEKKEKKNAKGNASEQRMKREAASWSLS